MPSLRSTIVAFVLASVVKADYIIDPSTVSEVDRATWCQSELSTCPLICSEIDNNPTLVNECDPDTLTYGCICGNGMAPNVSEYTLTLPYFTCVEWGSQCVEACGSDNACAGSCREDNPCGAQDPPKPNTTATTTGEPTASSTSDAEEAINTKVLDQNGNNAAAALEMGRSYGLVILASTLFAGFALL